MAESALNYAGRLRFEVFRIQRPFFYTRPEVDTERRRTSGPEMHGAVWRRQLGDE